MTHFLCVRNVVTVQLELISVRHTHVAYICVNGELNNHYFVQAIIDCRFFTLFAVAGSLIGSVLCFVEVFMKLCPLFSFPLCFCYYKDKKES